MALEIQVLGRPGRDNALWVKVDSGQAQHRLLFDCGEGCLPALPRSEILEMDHLFFSHFHLDHVCGFDSLFRRIYNRESKPMGVWGPAGTVDLLHHRFQSFWWNLHKNQGGQWEVRDVGPEGVTAASRFLTREAFALRHPLPIPPGPSPIHIGEDFSVEAMVLEHHGPSIAFLVREPFRVHVRSERLAELGIRPGPWVRQLKEGVFEDELVSADGTRWTAPALREILLWESKGESVAYLTDFLLDDAARERLVPWLKGIGTLVCESQYRHADRDLAKKNCHATARGVAKLARDAEVNRLLLMHLSERYSERDWESMLREARRVFPPSEFPPAWEIG